MVTLNIGVAIGQRRSHSSIAVVEVEDLSQVAYHSAEPKYEDDVSAAYGFTREATEGEGQHKDRFIIRHLERLSAGAKYPQIATRLGEIITGAKLRARGRRSYRKEPDVAVYADVTGLGEPVLDILAKVAKEVRAVYFTHGDRRTVESYNQITLGKAWLVARLQALLQTDRLDLPDTEEARRLAKELLDYEIAVTEDANERYGAFKVGSQDYHVTSIGLACQEANLIDWRAWDALVEYLENDLWYL